jgi:predicted ATPase
MAPLLVGREAEMTLIDRLVDGGRSGRSGVALFRGAAGTGKSALLNLASDRARGIRVLRSVGVPAESELGFAGLHQLLRPLLDRVGSLPAPQCRALRSALAWCRRPPIRC